MLLFICSFGIEDLTPEHSTEQSGAESDTGFSSARAVQDAVQAGATCIGRTHTTEVACRYVGLPEISAFFTGNFAELRMYVLHLRDQGFFGRAG